MDQRGLTLYTKYLPKLVKFEMEQLGHSELVNISPTFYAGDFSKSLDQRGFFLIMEDLTPDFEMVNNLDGLSLKQLNSALKKIARFHAVSYAFGQVNQLDFGTILKPKFAQFMSDLNQLTLAVADLESNDKTKHLAKPIANLAKNYQKSFDKAVGLVFPIPVIPIPENREYSGLQYRYRQI
jgi:hypothetical protein